MKKVIALVVLLCGFMPVLWAADGCDQHLSREEFRAKQKEFITEQAGLSKKEAAKFFPVYFELQDKKFQYNKEAWDKIKKGKRDKNLTDAEYSKITEDIVKSRITVDELELEYLKKYRKILPAKKIFEIQRAEMRFHRELLKDTKNNRPHNGK